MPQGDSPVRDLLRIFVGMEVMEVILIRKYRRRMVPYHTGGPFLSILAGYQLF